METEFTEYGYSSSGGHDKWKKLIITAVNSLALYLLAYLFVYLFFNIITFVRGSDFGMHARLLYWEIDWVTDWMNGFGFNAWNTSSVKNVFCIGPFSCAIISVIIALFYVFRKSKNDLLSLFCIWLVLHCLNMFFGAVITGIITTINYTYDNQILKVICDNLFFTKENVYSSWGLGWVFDYMFIKTSVKVMIFIVCFLASVVIGYFSAIIFLRNSQSTSLVQNKKNRKQLILFQTIIPWTLGTLILLFIKYPHNVRYDIYFYITILLFILPAYFHVQRNPAKISNIYIDRNPKTMRVSIINIIIVIIFYVAFRILFEDGIYISKLILKYL